MRQLTLLSIVVILAGCATTGSGDGHIIIETSSQGQPLTAARCVVKTDGATWNLTTPTDVVISVADGDLHVACSKVGYRTAEVVYKAPPGVGLPNMGLGGSGLGMGMDLRLPVNLGDKNVAYPSRVMVELERL